MGRCRKVEHDGRVRFLAEHAVKLGVVDKVVRENGAGGLGRARAQAVAGKKCGAFRSPNDEFIERMENVVELYARPFNWKEPVVALEERPGA